MNHIFISYSRRDTEYVNSVVSLLKDSGLAVWQDISGKGSGIPFSTKWFSAIEEALHTSAGAVVFDSSYWQKSVPCRKEYDIVQNLHIPCFRVEMTGQIPSAETTAEEIIAWSEKEVYGPEENDLRTWLMSSLNSQRHSRSLNTGIPHCTSKAEAQQFLSRLDAAEKLAEQYHFADGQPQLYREIQKFLKKARRITRWDRIKKPLALGLAALLIGGIVLGNVLYSKERQKTDQHLLALQNLDVIHDRMESDPVTALKMMANDTNNYGDYITLLFENYASALDTVFPSDFRPSGSQEAGMISEPEYDSEEYDIEVNDHNGTVQIGKKQTDEDIPQETVSVRLAAKAEHMAVSSQYLAVSAGSKAYVIDMANGRDAVELSGCYRHISDILFDSDGRILAVTDAGDVYVWDNPIEAIICKDGRTAKMSETCDSSDGRFHIEADPYGTVKVYDTKTDTIIKTCSLIREPVVGCSLDETDWKIYVKGISQTLYCLDASDVLANYSTDPAVQKANYDELAFKVIYQMTDKLKIIR